MNSSEFYAELVEAFNRHKRLSHHTPGRGAFVKAGDSRWHQLRLSDYAISVRDKIFTPRLSINIHWSNLKLTHAIAKAWNVPRDSEGQFSKFGLEITVRPFELQELAYTCPEIIQRIETGNEEFISTLPFEARNITNTNLWSLDADNYEKMQANKTLQLTPSRDAPTFYDRPACIHTLSALVGMFGVAELGVRAF